MKSRLSTVKAAIWKNDTSNGVRYNVTFSRLYKDKEDRPMAIHRQLWPR